MYNPQLETFLRVADAGSFSKAASQLFINPSAVIKQINRLEARLNVKLFIRTSHGLTLTTSGKALCKEAKHIIQYCNKAATRIKNMSDEDSFIIRIGVVHMISGTHLPTLWAEVQRQCPGIKFQFVPLEDTKKNVWNHLEHMEQTIDVLPTICSRSFLEARNCAALKLWDAPIQCAVPMNHRLAKKKLLTVQDLYGETLLFYSESVSQEDNLTHIAESLQKQHPQIHTLNVGFFNIDLFNRCVEENCIAMVAGGVERIHPLLKVISVDWSYTIPFGLLHAPKPSAHVQRFLDEIRVALCSEEFQA